jgi:hypothetical protein
MCGETFWEPEELEKFKEARRKKLKIDLDHYYDHDQGYSKRKESQTDIENCRGCGTYDREILYNRYRG